MGEKVNFLKFDCMTVISLSTSITNAIMEMDRPPKPLQFNTLVIYILQRAC